MKVHITPSRDDKGGRTDTGLVKNHQPVYLERSGQTGVSLKVQLMLCIDSMY